MANHLKMAVIQAIMLLHQQGWSHRRIARELGVHRETVAWHIRLMSHERSKPAKAPPGSQGAPAGQRVELVVRYHGRRKHLPVIELKRVA